MPITKEMARRTRIQMIQGVANASLATIRKNPPVIKNPTKWAVVEDHSTCINGSFSRLKRGTIIEDAREAALLREDGCVLQAVA